MENSREHLEVHHGVPPAAPMYPFLELDKYWDPIWQFIRNEFPEAFRDGLDPQALTLTCTPHTRLQDHLIVMTKDVPIVTYVEHCCIHIDMT